jgi:ABC-type cobalamin/Fe3+-siderophores transport system ATPase subunit
MNLAMRNVSAGYGARTVISEICASFRSGEVVCMLGPNGCGKTTLFKALLGLIPSQGDLLFGARSLRTLSSRERARTLAYVPQVHSPPFPFSALDVVLMGRTPFVGVFSAPSPADTDEAVRTMGMLRIGHLCDRDYSQLSGGERQLVLIARALAQAPRFLVMDEPTSHLDFGNQIRALNLIRELATSDMGVILTTHVPDHAFMCASRVIALLDGRIVGSGPPHEVLTRELLREMYRVDVDVVSVARGRSMCVPVMEEAMWHVRSS